MLDRNYKSKALGEALPYTDKPCGFSVYGRISLQTNPIWRCTYDQGKNCKRVF